MVLGSGQMLTFIRMVGQVILFLNFLLQRHETDLTCSNAIDSLDTKHNKEK